MIEKSPPSPSSISKTYPIKFESGWVNMAQSICSEVLDKGTIVKDPGAIGNGLAENETDKDLDCYSGVDELNILIATYWNRYLTSLVSPVI